MGKLLIFAGTTEGRLLGEYCAVHYIAADVSAATEYGAALLPSGVGVLSGSLYADGIRALLYSGVYDTVIDATHPYAVAVTKTLKTICAECAVPYCRLLRKSEPVSGESADTVGEIVTMLNACSCVVFSTLGSHSAADLTAVHGYRERIWLRVLPAEENVQKCIALGYGPAHIIAEKGPFTAEQNLAHIRQSGAGILLTKESGRSADIPKRRRPSDARESG